MNHKRVELSVKNTSFEKRQEDRMTYKSGGRNTQWDYILCRLCSLKEISDSKVVVSGCCEARQHGIVVSLVSLVVRPRREIEMERSCSR